MKLATQGGANGSSVWRGGLPTQRFVDGVLIAGGRTAPGGGGSSAAGAGPGPGPSPPVPTPVSAGPETMPGLEARPSETRLPAAGGGGGSSSDGGTGAYSSVSVGLAWGRFSADGRTATAMRTASAMASSGGYFRAHVEPFRRSSGEPNTSANRASPRSTWGRENPP